MSTSLLGLGFSFGAEDKGLVDTQTKIAQGFDTISDQMQWLQGVTNETDWSQMVPEGQKEKIQDFSSAFDELADKVGKELPESAKRGSDQFSRSSREYEKRQRDVGGGFNYIRDTVEKLDASLHQNKLQTFLQSLSLSQLNNIAQDLGAAGDQGLNLTTAFESTVVGLNKSSREMGANFGFTGKKLDEFTRKSTQLALQLNIDAATAAKALKAWTKASESLAGTGLESAEDLAKLSAAFGVNADIFRSSAEFLNKSLKLSVEETGNVIKSFTAMGQATGDVSGALNEMPNMIEMLGRKASLMGKQLNGADLAKFAMDTNAVAAAFFQVDKNAETSRKAASSLADTLLKSGEDFANLTKGVGTDLNKFATELAISTGDIGVSFGAMSQSPAEFLSGLSKMVKSAKDMGKNVGPQLEFMRARLSEVFGSQGSSQLINFFNLADGAALDMLSGFNKKLLPDLQKVAKEAHRTGFTLADRFNRARDVLVKGFRDIGRSASKDFVKDSKKAFAEFNIGLKDIASEGGLLGAFITKMSEAHQLGVQAFIPEALRPMTVLFGSMANELAPTITALGALGFRLKHLVNPFVLLGAAAGGFFALLKKNEMSLRVHDKSYQKQVKSVDKLRKALDRQGKRGSINVNTQKKLVQEEAKLAAMREGIAKEARKQTVVQFEKGVSDTVDKVVMGLGVLSSKLEEWIPEISKFVGSMWDALIGGVDPNAEGSGPAERMGAKIGGALHKAFDVALSSFKSYISGWWENLGEIWADDSKPFTDKIVETLGSSSGLLLGAFAVAKFTPIFGVLGKLSSVLGGLFKGFGGLGSVGGVTKGLFTVVKAIFSVKAALLGAVAVVGALTVGFLAFPKKTKAFIEKAGVMIKGFFKNLGELTGKAVGWVGAKLAEGVSVAWDTVTDPTKFMNFLDRFSDAFWNAIEGALTLLKNAYVGFTQGLAEEIVKFLPSLKPLRRFVSDVNDFLNRDNPDLTAREANRLKGLKANLARSTELTEGQIATVTEAAAKSDILRENSHFKLIEALKFAEGDIQKAIMLTGNVARFEGAKTTFMNKSQFDKYLSVRKMQEAIVQKEVANTTNEVVKGAEKQAEAAKGANKSLESGLDDSISKILNVRAKDVKKIGPLATESFSEGVVAMDKFGGRFQQLFEGKTSIGIRAKEAFGMIKDAAKDLQHTLIEVFSGTWLEIMNQSIMAINSVRNDALRMSNQVNAVTAVSSFMSSLANNKDSSNVEVKKTFKSQQSGDSQLFEAIHAPEWYYDDYRGKVDLLISQLASMNANLAGSGSSRKGTTPLSQGGVPASDSDSARTARFFGRSSGTDSSGNPATYRAGRRVVGSGGSR